MQKLWPAWYSLAMYDAIVVGGGPAGSTCARVLVRAGARVAIIDRATFPRVKLCAGWLSPPFWDVIERTPPLRALDRLGRLPADAA